jgi:hypothetical protein
LQTDNITIPSRTFRFCFLLQTDNITIPSRTFKQRSRSAMAATQSHDLFQMLLLIALASHFFASAAKGSKTYQWKKMYQFPLEGQNIMKDCKLPNGSPICCSALSGHFNKTTTGGDRERRKKRRGKCITTRTYESSDYEMRHLEAAQTLKGVGPLWNFVQSPEEMLSATNWLQDVKSLMTEDHYGAALEPNQTHLSRFIVTEDCGDAGSTSSVEYIEPITVTARHPFAWSWSGCDNNVAKKGFKKWARKDKRTHLCDTDFVVLANKQWTQNSAKKYFFDAGSSTFDSSGWWFMCGYSQVRAAAQARQGQHSLIKELRVTLVMLYEWDQLILILCLCVSTYMSCMFVSCYFSACLLCVCVC